MTKRILVTGVGSVGLRHARLLSQHEDCLVEVCDVCPEALEEASRQIPNVRCWPAYGKALHTNPDIVFIATPPSSHASLAVAALQSGADVFCEKPMAGDLADAYQIVNEARRSTHLLNVGYVQRFFPELVETKRLLRTGLLGELCFLRYSVATYDTLAFSRSRHQSDVFAAAALDYAYSFDTFWWLTRQPPVAVFAKGEYVEKMPLKSNPNLISAIVDYTGSMLAEVHIDYLAKPARYSLTLQGTEAFVHVDLIDHRVEIGELSSDSKRIQHFDYQRNDLMRRQHDHFMAAVRGEHPVSTSPEEGLQANLGVDALVRSLKSRKVEAISCSQV